MEGVVAFGPCAYASLSSPSLVISARRNPNFSREKYRPARIVGARLWRSLLCLSKNVDNRPRGCEPVLYVLGDYRHMFFGQPIQRLDRKIAVLSGLFSVRNECLRKSRKYIWKLQKALKYSENIRNHLSILFVRHIVGMVLVMIISVAVSRIPSYALTEENLLFLEAWRTIDRAYIDKTFNGQSWFRYRENALRNEPMNTREETCMLFVLYRGLHLF
ncbi:C-terminal processing peptidase [Sarracenia purpurea var. burkii]